MPIPLARLTSWSNQGAVQTSALVYQSIRNALEAATSPLKGRSVEIFLQGSYANSTNIRGDSDVDVVVLYGSTFHWDHNSLSSLDQQTHERIYPTADYQWHHLKSDVLSALEGYFGLAAVNPGNKAIEVKTAYGTRTADVIPVVEHRAYTRFNDPHNPWAHWGIVFFDGSGRAIVNYPKQHIENGVDKNSAARTQGRYKPIVRVFKNFRNHLVDNRLLADGLVPSYFLESLLHGVPDHLFIGSFDQTIPQILIHLAETNCNGHLCQNGRTSLFGSEPTQWSYADFQTFLVAALTRWNNWREA